MIDELQIFGRFIVFICQYSLIKCFKTMFMGILIVPFIWFIRICNQGKSANVNFYSTLLILPMAFMGMNKVFYKRHVYKVTYIICMMAKTKFSVLYFGIFLTLLIYAIYKNAKLRKCIAGFELFENNNLKKRAVKSVLGDVNSFVVKEYLEHVKIYVAAEDISPFSGGIFRPYIVIPKKLFADSSDEERFMMLCHEYMHIRSGHIVWLTLFRLLWIYWWINPLMFLLNRRLYDDMEMSCDEKCIRYIKAEPYSYASVLLMVAENIKPSVAKSVATFVGNNDYRRIKKRISYIESSENKKSFFKKQKLQGIIFTFIFAGFIIGIYFSSYPKFTVLDEIYLYDEQLNLRITDMEEMNRAVEVKGGRLIINHEEFDSLLKRYHISGDYVYVSFDTIMKVPGCGGGGNAGMISTEDYDDIFYLAADTTENNIMIFIMKYIL